MLYRPAGQLTPQAASFAVCADRKHCVITDALQAQQGLSSSALGLYLSLSNCLKGLCGIVHQLTGVSLQKEPLQSGEIAMLANTIVQTLGGFLGDCA